MFIVKIYNEFWGILHAATAITLIGVLILNQLFSNFWNLKMRTHILFCSFAFILYFINSMSMCYYSLC